jgi:hypothetical protein
LYEVFVDFIQALEIEAVIKFSSFLGALMMSEKVWKCQGHGKVSRFLKGLIFATEYL